MLDLFSHTEGNTIDDNPIGEATITIYLIQDVRTTMGPIDKSFTDIAPTDNDVQLALGKCSTMAPLCPSPGSQAPMSSMPNPTMWTLDYDHADEPLAQLAGQVAPQQLIGELDLVSEPPSRGNLHATKARPGVS